MRRYRRRSLMGSFAYGLVIAASGAGLAVAAHHMLAPPGPEDEGSVSGGNMTETATATLERWSRLFGMHKSEAASQDAAQPAAAPFAAAAKPEAKSDGEERQKQATAEASRVLVRNIQTELQRVGCYAGSTHGNWDMPTQLALAAFNEIVKVQIRSSGPEYVHLTLLQGHGTRACARACTVEDGIKGCVPKPMVAKARPAEQSAAPAGAAKAEKAPEAPRVAAAPPPPVTAPTPPSPVLIREGSWRPATGSMPPAAPPAAQGNPPASLGTPQVAAAPPVAPPLPGRSALGGPSTPDQADPAALSPIALTPGTALPANPAGRPVAPPRREARETPRRNGGGSGASEGQTRSREIFTRLSRDSP